MVRIYTKGGDQGETSLVGGQRVSKSSSRIEAYGTADELNALLGYAAAIQEDGALADKLSAIQNDLHTLCADLADPKGSGPQVRPDDVAKLEAWCDELDGQLPALKQFILPGGSRSGATLHLARTVARRVERRVIALGQREAVNPEALKYLNRLSDLLFLMARTANLAAGESERHPNYGGAAEEAA